MAAENDRDEDHEGAGDAAHMVLAKHPCVVPGKIEGAGEPADREPAEVDEAEQLSRHRSR